MTRSAYHLPAGYILTVAVVGGVVITEQQQDPTIRAVGAATFGPYLVDRDFIIHGAASWTVALGEAGGSPPDGFAYVITEIV